MTQVRFALGLCALFSMGIPRVAFGAAHLTLWHSYRGAEEEALQQSIALFNGSQPHIAVELLAIPHEVLASKLTTAIPRGNGPDLFIFAHERIGGWVDARILAPVPVDAIERDAYLQETLAPLTYKGNLYALPLAFKSLALFYNRALVTTPPPTMEAVLDQGAIPTGVFPLAYEAGNPYHHAPWYFAFGGALFDPEGRLNFDTVEVSKSLGFVRRLKDRGIIPEEVTGALVRDLFNRGQARYVINGPWFVGEIDPSISFSIMPLPPFGDTGALPKPFLTDEGVFVASTSAEQTASWTAAQFLAGKESALLRARIGRQVVANNAAWDDNHLAQDPVLAAFRAQLPQTIPMDNAPRMRDLWEPLQLGLRKALRNEGTPEQAARAAQRRYRAITRPEPPAVDPWPYIIASGALGVVALILWLRWAGRVVRSQNMRTSARSWVWVAPTLGAVGVLVFLPFSVGLVLSLFSHRAGDWTFVGFANFFEILAAKSYGPMEPLSFYYALAVTILWTGLNLFLHLSIGLSLALLLNRKGLRIKPLYRVLLILPWAVPNYITALIWKGLFHKQFGAINGLLGLVGVEPISWFSSFWTALFANVSTNAWLGFPFMMVVCLGALQSIPQDLYEAADVDGASAWTKFRHVTLPLLVPALVPATLLGIVWTFNQFNIVYLVSGGEPDNATDILISEAYRWAFTRQEQYGYAAAYAALIFFLLLAWSAVSSRISRIAEAMR